MDSKSSSVTGYAPSHCHAFHSFNRSASTTWSISWLIISQHIRLLLRFQLAPCFFFFSHSSGVKHLGVQACIAAISCFKAPFTNRCLAKVVFFANCGETMMASYIWPQPPRLYTSAAPSMLHISISHLINPQYRHVVLPAFLSIYCVTSLA